MPNYSGTHAAPRTELGVAMQEYIQTLDEFIGSKILAGLMVPRKTAYFPKVMREGFLRTAVVKRIARAGYNRDTFLVEDSSYACEERGLEGPLDDADREFYTREFDAEMNTVATITRRVVQDYEIDVASAIFNSSTWTGSTLNTSVSTEWSTVSADVIGDVAGAKESSRRLTGVEPDTLICSQVVWKNIKRNEGILERVQYASEAGDAKMAGSIPGILGLPKILVGKGVYNSAKEGQTAVIADIWDDEYCMIAKTANEGAQLTEPCVGRTFVWSGDAPVEAGGVIVEQYRDERVRGDVFRSRMHSDELIFDASYAHLLDNITA
ncbi:MAG: hypothetical protein GY851_03340 [bacterium]|nr:hypothetical protein [bacterium]